MVTGPVEGWRAKPGETGMPEPKIAIPHDGLEAFCRKWKVEEFSLFGSVLRDDFRPDSDVDVLVVIAEGAGWSLFDLVEMKEELEFLFGRAVHLVEKDALRNPFRRKEILETRMVVHVAA